MKYIIKIIVSISLCILIYGLVNSMVVIKKDYNISSSTLNNNYKICFISDLHYGAKQPSFVIDNLIKSLNNENLDILILGGDIVEEETDIEELIEILAKLSSINTNYGIFYVYGNHDMKFEKIQKVSILDCLSTTDIKLLADNNICINELNIVGRRDAHKEYLTRKDISMLYDKSKYNIVIDHMPVDFKYNSYIGYDLQLSGHTHAGQIMIGNIITSNEHEYMYGKHNIGDSSIIVSSGCGVSKIPIRTMEHCEYVIINLRKE